MDDKQAIYLEAIERVETLLKHARDTSLREPMAMSLATVNEDNQPSVRVVLLRGFDERGFVFYTNTRSAKGRELSANPHAALVFHWDELGEQLRVQGATQPVKDAEADAYWRSRPRESQIGGWASQQSETLDAMATLEQRVAEFEQKFDGQDVPRPSHWSGYRLVPQRIEFWSNRSARLHERFVYERADSGVWSVGRLFP